MADRPRARLRREPWDDDVADTVAIVEAVREDRVGDLAVLLRHANATRCLVTAAKLLAEAGEDSGATAEHFRRWARQAVNRA